MTNRKTSPEIHGSEFSRFICGVGEYTPDKKREIMLDVADKACERQRESMLMNKKPLPKSGDEQDATYSRRMIYLRQLKKIKRRMNKRFRKAGKINRFSAHSDNWSDL